MKVLRGFSRKFLMAASAYRRQAKMQKGLDWGIDALTAQHAFESRGGKSPDPRQNGYTYGKWVLEVTLKTMKQDHQDGLFTKHELMQGSCAFVRRAIHRWPAVSFIRFRRRK